ncbi:glycosyltransferase [Candidatus Woesearchaeota archaeon]|nr:glycosyltransferase [Candidatus Woesearchaeota archaeon]
MKIAIFTDTFLPNLDGVVTSITNSTGILARKGHKFLIIAPDYNKRQGVKLHKNIKVVRIKSIPLPGYRDFRYVLPFFKKCLKEVKLFNPDLIHMESYSTLGIFGSKIAKKLSLPLIGTYHTIAAEFARYLSPSSLLCLEKFFSRLKPRKSVFKIKTKDDTLTKRIIWKVTISLYNKCDLVISPSEAIKKVLNKKGLKRKVVVISNGVDTGLFRPKKFYRKKIKKIIHVGRVSYEKNIDRILKAFSLLPEKISGVEFSIIGNGPALESLKRLSADLGIAQQVKFLGPIPHKKLPYYYQESDIFVTCSTMETQGLVILEAMSSGLPVIGVNKFAIPDIVRDRHNGLIVQPSDIKGLKASMEALIKNPRLVKAFGKNAVNSAKSHDINKTTKLLEEAYKKILLTKKTSQTRQIG